MKSAPQADYLNFHRLIFHSLNPGPGAYMNRMLVGFAVLAIGAVSVGASIIKKQAFAESHRRSRQIILYYTLSRTNNPIIVLGDSIVEASTLPRELCGHAIVNAGLDGASTRSDLGDWLMDALDGKPAAAIVVALGINDALGAARDLPQFESNYSSLVATLSKATARVIALEVPPLDASPRFSVETRTNATRLIDSYNSALPALAVRSGATLAALPPLPTPHTIDGVHLSAAGYQLWNEAVLRGASVSCGST